MRAYAMQGTPTTVLIDAQGRLRQQVFGAYDDLRLGADLGALLSESERRPAGPVEIAVPAMDSCSADGCR